MAATGSGCCANYGTSLRTWPYRNWLTWWHGKILVLSKNTGRVDTVSASTTNAKRRTLSIVNQTMRAGGMILQQKKKCSMSNHYDLPITGTLISYHFWLIFSAKNDGNSLDWPTGSRRHLSVARSSQTILTVWKLETTMGEAFIYDTSIYGEYLKRRQVITLYRFLEYKDQLDSNRDRVGDWLSCHLDRLLK